MTREILFRGFHKDKNGKETIYINGQVIKGKWVYGSLIKLESVLDSTKYYYYIDDEYGDRDEVIPETVGQYINRLDKNDNKIFEGCRCKHYINKDFIVCPEGTVEYLNDRFILKYNDNNYTDFMFIKSKDIEVIGTIFDKEVE